MTRTVLELTTEQVRSIAADIPGLLQRADPNVTSITRYIVLYRPVHAIGVIPAQLYRRP